MASDPSNVIDMEMVRVKPGQEESFQELRKSYITKARNSRNVRHVVTFKNVPILDGLARDSPFYFDSANNELMLTSYVDREAIQQHRLNRKFIRVSCFARHWFS